MGSTHRYYWSTEISERMSAIISYIQENIGSVSYMAFELTDDSIDQLIENISASMEISNSRFDLSIDKESLFICSHFSRKTEYALIDFYNGRLNFSSPDEVFMLKALTALLSLPEA